MFCMWKCLVLMDFNSLSSAVLLFLMSLKSCNSLLLKILSSICLNKHSKPLLFSLHPLIISDHPFVSSQCFRIQILGWTGRSFLSPDIKPLWSIKVLIEYIGPLIAVLFFQDMFEMDFTILYSVKLHPAVLLRLQLSPDKKTRYAAFETKIFPCVKIPSYLSCMQCSPS